MALDFFSFFSEMEPRLKPETSTDSSSPSGMSVYLAGQGLTGSGFWKEQTECSLG